MAIKARGIYERKGVREYAHWMNNLPQDRVVKDEVMFRALRKIGYEAEFDPASYFDIKQLWSALENYSSEDLLTEDFLRSDPISNRALKRTYAQFACKGQKLKVLDDFNEIYKVIQKDTSAGLPYMTKKAEAFPLAYSRFVDVLKGSKAFNPCLAQFRTQRGNKTRLVWAYPLDATIAESRFAYSLIEYYKNNETPMTLGLYKNQIGARLQNVAGRYIYQLDYSKFDGTISKQLIKMAFGIFRTHFNLDDEQYTNFKQVESYFIHTPIVMPDGKLYVGKEKGVPSGSYFTNLVDSIVNYFLIEYINIKFKMSVPKDSILVMGDDSVFASNVKVSFDEIKNTLSRFGIIVNTVKSRISDHKDSVHFVGFDWKGGVPDKKFSEVLKSLVYPERYRKFDDAERHVRAMFTQAALLSREAFILLSKRYPNEKRKLLFTNAPGSGGYLSSYSEYMDKYVHSGNRYSYFTLGGHYFL